MRPWVSLALAASVATAGAAAVAATPPPPPMASGEECDAYIANNISWPAVEDKCGCAIAIGPSSIVPYMKWHYCDLACVPGISFFLCAAWLLFLFSIVASTADEYLVPNLERLSDMLQLSPNVAGVSLLALGNGAPDFFTSFASFTQGTGDIGIGSLLGGGLFITSLVFGSVMIVAPFKSHRRPLLLFGELRPRTAARMGLGARLPAARRKTQCVQGLLLRKTHIPPLTRRDPGRAQFYLRSARRACGQGASRQSSACRTPPKLNSLEVAK